MRRSTIRSPHVLLSLYNTLSNAAAAVSQLLQHSSAASDAQRPHSPAATAAMSPLHSMRRLSEFAHTLSTMEWKKGVNIGYS